MAWSSSRSRLGGLIACVAALSVAACGDDGPAPPVTFDGGDDGGGGMDAGDGGGMDGDLDGGGDGSAGDGGVGPGTCRYSPGGDLFELGTDSMGRQRRVSIAPAADGFLVAWAATDGGENAFARWIPSGGSAGARQNVTEGFSIVRDPAVTLSGDGFLASWIDNSEGNFELWARPLDASGAPSGSAMRLTSNDSREEAPALLTKAPGALVAWIEAGTGSDTFRKAWTRLLDADGAASGGANEITSDMQRPTRPALAATAAGNAIAWTQSTGDMPHAWLQKLDGDGMPMGDPQQLDSEGNVAGNVDLAMTEMAGMAAFDVSVSGVTSEIRLRPLDGDGSVSGSEKSAVGGTETGVDASIAPFAGGYVLAYRALSGEDIDGPTVRLAFLDGLGERIETMDLASASDVGGVTRVAVSFDGNIMVTWSDRGDDATTLRASRVRCSGTVPGMDGGMDGGVPTDAGEDSGLPPPMDAGGIDAAACVGPDGGFDPCSCPGPFPNDCSSSPCPDDRAECVADGCGGERCVIAGHLCSSAADCPSGSACVDIPGFRMCESTGGDECNDSRDCPVGFACESGSCVDRRIPCSSADDDCPMGFFCHTDAFLGSSFCAPVYSRCESSAGCVGEDALCRDVDGDGLGECTFDGTCDTNIDCTGTGSVCGVAPDATASCMMHGPCDSGADCASGWECVDLWGDGIAQCVPTGGSCSAAADCSEHAVCASPSAGAAPECVARAWD